MRIEPQQLAIRQIFEGFTDLDEQGVTAYGGLLDIRPKYQREFVYNEKQQKAVIHTIFKNFPLNIMYWAVNEHDDGNKTYEVLDGQQRTMSFCRYINGDFSVEVDGSPKYFHNLPDDKKEEILSYEVLVYLCTGTDSEKLQWFKTINIAGEKLTDQELRNAVYTGPWLTNAKYQFSRPGQAGDLLAKDYVSADAKRQGLLETALKWKSQGQIEEYMAAHQHDMNAQPLWSYFREVIEWVERTFTTKRKEMKSVDWGPLYDDFKDTHLDPVALEEQVAELMMDDEVTKKSGIYPYILLQDPRFLNLRTFSPKMKREAYEHQQGKCASGDSCLSPAGTVFELSQMQADHITPWSAGGKTSPENCQMLCADCNRRKSNI